MRFETIYASQYLVSRLDYARAVDNIRDDGDIIQIDLNTGQQVMILLIERSMSISDVRHYYEANTRNGVYTLMLLWAPVFLPQDGDTYRLDDWMQVLVTLHGDKIYGYEVAGRDAFFFPVHMQGRTLKRKIRYGTIVNYGSIGGRKINTLNPYMPGEWYVAGFDFEAQGYRHYASTDIGTETDPLLAYFDVLGVPRFADATAIKLAYRTLARLYHPDVNATAEADTRMRRINEAYAKVMKEFD
ncbi:MAG: DnaJ domain-containing protein [Chloroflexota bacterium]